eukprot:3715319-Prymnesium_polylepis.1
MSKRAAAAGSRGGGADIRSFFGRATPTSLPAATEAIAPPPAPPTLPSDPAHDTFGASPDADLADFDLDAAISSVRPTEAASASVSSVRPTEATSASAPPRPTPKATVQMGLFQSTGRVPRPPRFPAPDAADPEDRQRLLRLQFERFGVSAVDASASAMVLDPAPLNEAQRVVAEQAAEQPLSVRAGAGTGKTHTMMRRAVHLVRSQQVAPQSILMLTFSVKAASELQSRLSTVFAAGSVQPLRLPVARTFHALGYFWIKQYWKLLGLGCPPVPLTGQAGQRALMRRVLEELVMDMRLQRCQQILAMPSQAPWESVVDVFQKQFPDEFARA